MVTRIMHNPNGSSVLRPTFFDETNNAFWKACMTLFLRFVDQAIWEVVENGWSPPTVEVEVNGVATTPEVKYWIATCAGLLTRLIEILQCAIPTGFCYMRFTMPSNPQIHGIHGGSL